MTLFRRRGRVLARLVDHEPRCSPNGCTTRTGRKRLGGGRSWWKCRGRGTRSKRGCGANRSAVDHIPMKLAVAGGFERNRPTACRRRRSPKTVETGRLERPVGRRGSRGGRTRQEEPRAAHDPLPRAGPTSRRSQLTASRFDDSDQLAWETHSLGVVTDPRRAASGRSAIRDALRDCQLRQRAVYGAGSPPSRDRSGRTRRPAPSAGHVVGRDARGSNSSR